MWWVIRLPTVPTVPLPGFSESLFLLHFFSVGTAFLLALLEWCNVLRQDGLSPAQMMFSRRQQMSLPVLPQGISIGNRPRLREQSEIARWRRHLINTPTLFLSWVWEMMPSFRITPQKKCNRQGRIKECMPHGCSHTFTFPGSEQELRCNCRFIRKL